jgi:hypothetical protein
MLKSCDVSHPKVVIKVDIPTLGIKNWTATFGDQSEEVITGFPPSKYFFNDLLCNLIIHYVKMLFRLLFAHSQQQNTEARLFEGRT